MDATPKCEELWGFRHGEFSAVNEALFERVHSEDRPDVDARLSGCIAARKPFASEFRVVWPDGSIHWLLVRGKFTFDLAGKPHHLCGAAMDITVSKEREESLLSATRAAEESNRIKAEFLANLSHEIRTPLTAIIGMTCLARRAEPSPQLDRYLTKIGNAAQSLLGIANNILDFSKIQAGKLELEHIPFALDDVLDGIRDILGQSAEQKGVEIAMHIAPETPRCLTGDPLRLGQILVNLVNNAIKFTPRGRVTVNVEASEVTGRKGLFCFSVSDTGIGMTAEQVANLFQSFNQADISFTRKYGGTGLGLVICKQLCGLMGGTLAVKSEPDKGSTFTLRASFDIAAEVGTLTCT
jgi:PAS domain S-box-containing protein